ncbi:MAG TPA: hypothetical protein VH301_00910 [Usitatibacter sp.]|nr:hypothetical protein [Usitatibacter sp.]
MPVRLAALFAISLVAAPQAQAAVSAQLVTPQRMSVAGGETKRFSVRFLDSTGHAAVGEAVRFANDACGRFANGQFTFDTTTDSTGVASADFTALSPAGITCWLVATAGVTAQFDVETYIASLAHPGAILDPGTPAPGQPFTVSASGSFGAYTLYNVDISARVIAGSASATISPAAQTTGDDGAAIFSVTPDGRLGSFDIELSFSGHTKTLHVAQPATGVQDMWWAGPGQNGWGMSLVQHPSGMIFATLYTYGEDGHPTWFVMPGGAWNDDRTAISGSLYSPRGAPFNAADLTHFAAGNPAGTATLTFVDLAHATLDYTVGGKAGTIEVVRQPF